MKLVALTCLASLGAITSAPPRADACSCIPERDRRATGVPTGKVPCNAHVFLRNVRDLSKIVIFDGKTKLKVTYVSIDRSGGLVELVPERLAPNRTYDVMEDGTLVLSFTTTATADKQAPVVERYTSELVPATSSCDMGSRPYLRMQAVMSTSAPADVVEFVAVWRADVNDHVDYTKEPDGYVPVWPAEQSFEFQLGRNHMCAPRGAPRVYPGDTAGFALVDLAGNRSKPVTIRLPASAKPHP